MGDTSADEFDQYDFSEFTAEDFVVVDTVSLSLSPAGTPTPNLGASTFTSVEAPADVPQNAARPYATKKSKGKRKRKKRKVDTVEGEATGSPFARYRSQKGTLSVSDLVGPSWCEVQFDYGLRQGRSKKLSERSPSFVTAAGKTITVEREVAKRNDTVQRRGSAIHKKLERELRPEETEVTVSTDAERWALKLIQMNACLDDLLSHGFCREMPVFGLIHDQVVTGIIDEITNRPLATQHSLMAKKLQPNGTHQQTQLSSYFTSSTPRQPSPTHELCISDSKTRRAFGLPSDEDAQPARLQLMLYHRLLAHLLDPQFDWSAFWKRVGVDAGAPLSDTFLKQTFLVPSHPQEVSADTESAASGSLSDREKENVYVGFPRSLDDLVDSLRPTVDAVTGSASNVSKTLEIVYRAQQARRKGRSSRRAQEELESGLREHTVNEDLDLQRAIAASLASHAGESDLSGMGANINSVMASLDAVMPPLGGATLEQDAHGLSSARVDSHLGRTLDSALGELAWAAQEAAVARVGDDQLNTLASTREAEDEGMRAVDYLQATHKETDGEVGARPLLGRAVEQDGCGSDSSEDDVVEEDIGGRAGRVIGRRVFDMDDGELDAHLDRVLGWWMGTREPEGVPVELSRRCFSCEYREGCEWREAKAREIAERFGVIHEEGSLESGSESDEDSDGTRSSAKRRRSVDAVANMF